MERVRQAGDLGQAGALATVAATTHPAGKIQVQAGGSTAGALAGSLVDVGAATAQAVVAVGDGGTSIMPPGCHAGRDGDHPR